jgi:hypothetical protein
MCHLFMLCLTVNTYCDDGDACTDDVCNLGGSPVTGCSHMPKDCSDGRSCTKDTCDAGQCVHTPGELHHYDYEAPVLSLTLS